MSEFCQMFACKERSYLKMVFEGDIYRAFEAIGVGDLVAKQLLWARFWLLCERFRLHGRDSVTCA